MLAVAWTTGEITVPLSYLTLEGGATYKLDMNQFHQDLRSLEAAEGGAPWPRTHDHNTEVALSGVPYARIVEILTPYFVTFEAGDYRVKPEGANHNLGDVATLASTQPQILQANSAGLIGGLRAATRGVHGSGGYDGTTLRCVFFARALGQVLTTPTAASIEVFDSTGTSLGSVSSGGGPTPQGVFGLAVAVNLAIDDGSFIEVVISDPGGDVEGIVPISRQS